MTNEDRKDIALVAACWIASFAVGHVVGQAAKALTKNSSFFVKIGAYAIAGFVSVRASDVIVKAALPYLSENRRGKA